jgi:gas vesicle protein
MSEKNDFGSFLIGFTIGALTGAAVSLLMAPQSGEETRKILKEKTIELKDKASETYVATKEKATQLFEEGKEKASQLSEEVKNKAIDAKQKSQVVVEEHQEKLAEAIRPKKVAEE